MAVWCVATGFGPSVYLDLTRSERAAFVSAVKQKYSK